MDEKSTERFELRLGPQTANALKLLAKSRGKSAAQVLKDYIESAAKRERVWPQ
jgi:predicted DNA-binding protein